MTRVKTFVLSGIGLALASTSAMAVTFSELDADGSGSVDATEFSTAFPDAPEGSFAQYDADGDGSISQTEAGGGSGDGGISFGEIDANDNGVLEPEEMKHVFGARAQVALAKFDKDGDGVVTLDEVRSSDDPKGERGHRDDNRGVEKRGGKRGEDNSGRGNASDRSDDRGRGGHGSDDAEEAEDRSDDSGHGGGNGNGGGNGGGRDR